ncbi:hypothetical protein B0T10DRAFT_452647 [Thelonectria olida]|uniref:Early meiotic induction protein 1 n=1 Tax=Thelonectria olida TaxID=1576542 RepID=A0A9P8WIE0_9HYPO|nr:hypothetical protein B0T10DRAFT_452647 [Thelonectria olida]
MGWLWASSSSAEKAPAPTDKESVPPSSISTSSPSSSTSEQIDPEVQKFLDLFNAQPEPPKPEPSSSQQQSSDKSSSSSISSWFSLRSSSSSSASRTAAQVEAPPGNTLSESLLPTEMSCRQAFDQAWACNSMGGQWNAVYRYGEMRSCSEHWDDFWFCMRTKSYGPEMRAKAVQAHYRNKEYAKYGTDKPSSEDIWQSRDEKVEPGSVFTEPIE